MSANAQKEAYHLENTFHIPSPGRWDYIAVCPSNGFIYVSHTSQVNILNKKTGDSVGVIPNTQGVHGIAFVTSLNKGYTSNGKANTLTVFDLKTNKVTGEIPVGENPDALLYDAFTKMLYVCNGKSNDMTVVDPVQDKVVKTLPLDGKPETAVSDGAGKLFINIEDKSEMVVVNAQNYSIMSHWKLGKGEEPSGLAIDTKTKRLFAGCSNKLLVVLDATNGKVVQQLPIGDGCDGVAFDPGTGLVFSSNGEGTLTVIKEHTASEFNVVGNIKTKRGARTLALDEETHKVYLPTADFEKTNEPKPRPVMIPGSFQVLVMSKD